MPLPFLDMIRRQDKGATIEKKIVSEAVGDASSDLKTCMQEFYRAVQEGSIDGMAQAFNSAYEVCETLDKSQLPSEDGV